MGSKHLKNRTNHPRFRKTTMRSEPTHTARGGTRRKMSPPICGDWHLPLSSYFPACCAVSGDFRRSEKELKFLIERWFRSISNCGFETESPAPRVPPTPQRGRCPGGFPQVSPRWAAGARVSRSVRLTFTMSISFHHDFIITVVEAAHLPAGRLDPRLKRGVSLPSCEGA